MNWDRFRKNAGMRVQVEPPECRLDLYSHVLPDRHDDWMIERFIDDGVVVLHNLATDHVIKLGKDHIYDFRSNPARSQDGLSFGFLVLKVQIFMKGVEAWVRPNGRPGERVSPSNAAHHQVQWMPYIHIDTAPFVPPTAKFIKIQYRLWSNEAAIPLLIRVASKPDGSGLSQEHSGPSGVIEQMLDSPNFYFSVSHPQVHYQVQVLGWEDAL
jgi:hypothetical protein